MKCFAILVITVCAVLFATACSRESVCAPEAVDLGVLLERLTNVNTIAEPPLGYSLMDNSYDRTGGNRDWAVYTRTEPSGRITIFQADGPGYVSRVWIASYHAERWLFFFDGESEPRIDVARDELFGERFPFVAPLAGQSSGGRYCLLPIPFSKSVRVEIVPSDLRADKRNYYQINYMKLKMPHEKVTSFPHRLTESQSNLVHAVNASHNSNAEEMTALSEELLSSAAVVELESGDAHTIWEDTGSGILEEFCLRVDSPGAADIMSVELLRNLRLVCFWDNKSFPSVDVPLGDFFCNAFYVRGFSAMPLAQAGTGTFTSRFPMPYAKGAKVQVANRSGIPVALSVASRGNKESSMGLKRRFHATWRASTDTGKPFEMIKAKASGHYVGCFVTAIGQDGSWNILEGDDYILPDVGRQPAQLGTGLEDYFSGAYYYTSLFDLPLHGLIEKGAMRTDQYRFHMLDSIGFDRSFEMGFEFGHGNAAKGYMSGVVYWYSDKAVNQELPREMEGLLRRPQDRFELYGMMTPFLMLEREGLHADAAARMDFLAQRYSRQPWVDLLRVRAVGYRELTMGFEKVRGEYQSYAKSRYPAAAKAAQDRLWLGSARDRALLGIHALAKYRLFRDGVLVAEGEGRNDLRVLRVPFDEEAHMWTVDLEPTRQGSFFSFCIRTCQGDITSEGAWEVLNTEPFPGRKPPEAFRGDAVLPNMTIWSFEPNAYVNMQSPASGIQLWSFWDSSPKIKKVRLQKELSLHDIKSLPFEERERAEEQLRMHAIE